MTGSVPGGQGRNGDGRLAAVVLAGGRATRLGGVDKPALLLGGRSLLARAVDAARTCGAEPVVVVGPERDGIDALWAREDPPFSGPAAALAAGLSRLDGAAGLAFALVLSADLRRPREVVDALLRAERGRDGVLLQDVDGHRQWLCGLYRLDALRAVVAELGDAAGASMGQFLSGLELRRHPIAAAVVADVDTPADARDAGITWPE